VVAVLRGCRLTEEAAETRCFIYIILDRRVSDPATQISSVRSSALRISCNEITFPMCTHCSHEATTARFPVASGVYTSIRR
jgi:hypothetical protein